MAQPLRNEHPDDRGQESRAEDAELLDDICTAMSQVESGDVMSDDDAKAELRKRFA